MARAVVAWASIWLARTAGEVGRGTERAKERARAGVLARTEDSASSLRSSKGALGQFSGLLSGVGRRAACVVWVGDALRLTLLPTPHAP